jgi:hypothetical protein
MSMGSVDMVEEIVPYFGLGALIGRDPAIGCYK